MATIMKKVSRRNIKRTTFKDIEMSYDPRGKNTPGSNGGVVLAKQTVFPSVYQAAQATPETAGAVMVGDALWNKYGDRVPSDTHRNFVPVRCDFNYEVASDSEGLPLNVGGEFTADLHRAALAGQVKFVGRANAACYSSPQLGVGTTESISTQGVMNIRAPGYHWDGTRAYLQPGDDVYLIPPPLRSLENGTSVEPAVHFEDLPMRHNPVLMPGNMANHGDETSAAVDRYYSMLQVAVSASMRDPTAIPEVPHLTRFCATMTGGWTDCTGGTGPLNYGLYMEVMLDKILSSMCERDRQVLFPGGPAANKYDFMVWVDETSLHIGYYTQQPKPQTSVALADDLKLVVKNLRQNSYANCADAVQLYIRTWASLYLMALIFEEIHSSKNETFFDKIAYKMQVAQNLFTMIKTNGSRVLVDYLNSKTEAALSTARMLAPAYAGTVVQASEQSGIVVIART
jgi:hypothetical protein